jgi:hypothetical protein
LEVHRTAKCTTAWKVWGGLLLGKSEQETNLEVPGLHIGHPGLPRTLRGRAATPQSASPTPHFLACSLP